MYHRIPDIVNMSEIKVGFFPLTKIVVDPLTNGLTL